MGKRFLFGFSMFFALVGVLLVDHLADFTWGFFLLCVGMTLGGVHELGRMFRYRGLPIDTRLLAITTVLVMLYVQLIAEPPRFGAFASLWGDGEPGYLFDAPEAWRQFMLAIPLLVAVIFPLVALTRRDVPNISARMTSNLGVFLYLIFPIAIILWIRRVPDAGPWLLYFLLAASRMGDVGAFLMGKAFGRHKLIPHLSAGKTIEGAVFGLVFSAVGGLLIVLWANWAIDGALKPVLVWTLLGLLVGVAAQAGDLVESAFKRAAGIKDSGQLVPAFGGIMDIMDNFMLTGPLLIVVLALWA
jgi:phosphatidate cytidylyltransferase